MQLPNVVSPNEEYYFRTSFASVIASGVDPEYFNIIGSVGSGMSVSQSSGNLVVTTGTTANAETILRSNRAFAGNLTLREMMTLSQRIVNQNFVVALTDVIGDALPMVINSATSVTINVPGHKFDSTNVGQYMYIGAVAGVSGTIPGRYALASVTKDYLTFTVSGFPASGSGTCSLFGWNYHRILYNGATATSAAIDAQRNGWNSGDSTITINTTASPGHVAVCNVEDGVVSWSDQLVASSTSFQQTVRGSRVQNIPSDTTGLFLQIRVTNGSTAPASTTTMTVGFVSVEQYNNFPVAISSVRPQSLNSAMPVAVVAGNNATSVNVGGSVAHDFSASGNPVRVAARAFTANYTAVSSGDVADLVTTLVGSLVTKPFAIPEQDWSYAAAASGIVNTTTAVTFKAAAGAGVRNYITDIDFMAEALTTATELVIRDGASGTVIWRTKIGTAGLLNGRNIVFQNPLKSTAATLLEVCTLTASGAGAVYFNARGYTAP